MNKERGLEIARTVRMANIQSGIKTKTLTPIEKLKKNPKSLRLSINAMCYDCQGRNADPGVVGRIRECEITDCPLYTVRPYRAKSSGVQSGN